MSQVIPPLAADWNHFFNIISYTAWMALAVVMGALIVFAIVYRERKGQHPRFIPRLGQGRARDGIYFASVSIILLFSFSFLSYQVLPNARVISADAITVDVSAFQWGWLFTYPNGVISTNNLNLPENANVIFNVTSLDVMHNFYLEDFRVSIDAIPGRHNILYVTMPALEGNSELNYTIRCKELCGIGHAFMIASMHIMTVNAYNQWLSNQSSSSGGS